MFAKLRSEGDGFKYEVPCSLKKSERAAFDYKVKVPGSLYSSESDGIDKKVPRALSYSQRDTV